MSGMPHLIRPPGQSQEVATMLDVIGSRARTEILHLLSVQGGLTTAGLTEALGSDRSATYRHLLMLEQHGYVMGEPGPEDRGTRKAVRWTPVQERIDEAARQWRAYASGGPDRHESSAPAAGS